MSITGIRAGFSRSVKRRSGLGTTRRRYGFVDQRRRLQRVPPRFVGQASGGEAAQFGVDQGQELVGGVCVALLEGVDQARAAWHDHRAVQAVQQTRSSKRDLTN